MVGVAEQSLPGREPIDWRAHYRIDPGAPWAECSVVDLSLARALVELADEPLGDVAVGQPLSLQIDSIADDDVGIVIGAVVVGHDRSDHGSPRLEIEFSARREERMLLHLLVRLHALV